MLVAVLAGYTLAVSIGSLFIDEDKGFVAAAPKDHQGKVWGKFSMYGDNDYCGLNIAWPLNHKPCRFIYSDLRPEIL